ncbi:MAG: nondiscriminating glutamyl-tRNA synthetase [Chloroflexota bacterium]|nr:nondiscriminating glutamyl-tRNA synthetase [Chloroflexota bacterium]
MSVRVRFAPSPTGSLHIGSVRTTLYNYFLARHDPDGTLILRIEDTDQERLVPGAIDGIYDGLHWFGISWDEGPREGGPYAPYVQSERLPMYQARARELVDKGAAYFCFCTKERLAQMRAAQQARGEITRYDRHCRDIVPAQAAERAKAEPHVIRLKVPEDGTIAIDDLVYGHIEWPLSSIEDQVLLKSDGFPTYQLAVVIDDHEMRIDPIIRGEEWLPSTPKHLLVYRAFGWTVPPHAHVPNVLGPDGKKLSKRHGATQVDEFIRAGYLPEAMVNFLALIGWSPGTEEEVFSMEDLVRRFRIDQVQKAGGKWDRDRLNYFNGLWIRRLSDDELLRRLDPFLPPEWDRARVRQVVPLIKERMTTLTEAKELIGFLFAERLELDRSILVPKKKEPHETVTALSRSTVALRFLEPFTAERIEQAIGAVAADTGWSVRDLTIAIRAAVTGRKVGPPLYESIALLGKDTVLERLEAAQELLAA